MSTAHAHEPDPTIGAAQLVELADGVHAWMQPDGGWWLNNAGAASGADGTLVVDTCATEERTRRFLEALVTASGGLPIRWAVNTHEHGDHTYGNSMLPEETALIGHPDMREALLADPVIDGCPPAWDPVPEWGAVVRRVPSIVTGADLTVYSGRRRIDVLHPGYHAHTTGDLIAWLPEERIVFAGDLIFHRLTPLVSGGSIDGGLRSLDWLASFEPEVLVPGHGALVTAGELASALGDHEAYYRFVREVADRGIREGIGPLDVARDTDLGRFGAWPDAERLLLNLHRAYAESGRGRFDLVAAFTDAIEWNGGVLTTHVCCGS